MVSFNPVCDSLENQTFLNLFFFPLYIVPSTFDCVDASIRDDRFHQNGDVRQHLRAKVAGGRGGRGERDAEAPSA